jgi:hypothetical protein
VTEINRNQDVDLFDGSTVALAAVGIVLIAVEIFACLPSDTQTLISSSASMLDMHEEWAQTVSIALNFLDVSKEFENQFYLAFVDIASIPPESIQLPPVMVNAYNAFLAYADTFAAGYGDYGTDVAYQINNMETGRVLGTMIENLIP